MGKLSQFRQDALDFMEDLKQERIELIKKGYYVPLTEQGMGLCIAINGEKSYLFELNGQYYRKPREGTIYYKYDLIEIEKRKVVEKLYTAIENKDLKSVKECFNQGIEVNFIDYARNRHTPLMWASQYGNNDIVKYLIEQGAEVNKTQNFNRDYPLVLATKQENIDIVKTLIANGADLNIKNQNNETALTIAQKLNNKELVTLLKGHKALEQAIQKSKQKTTKLQKTKSKSNDFGMTM